MWATEIKFRSALNLCFCRSGVADEGLVHKRKWYLYAAQSNTSIDAIVQLASLSLILMMCVVGCSRVPQTEIIVQVPSDLRASKQASVEDILLIIGNTVTQFGLRETEGQKSQVCYSGVPSDSDERTTIWLTVYPDEIPLVIGIVDGSSSHRTVKHRQLADALVTHLNKSGLIASVTFHTPDPGDGVWVLYSALGTVAAWIVWRRFRHKQVVTA